MELSIIVPIYRVEPYLSQCVESILSQTFTRFEVLLVDDGSPDRCPAICDAYASKDPRVRVLHKPNGGLVSARQAGLAAARGAYIGFVDGDDWVEPDMFQKMMEAVAAEDADAVQCAFFCSFPDREETSRQHLDRAVYHRAQLTAELHPHLIFGRTLGDFQVVPSCWSKVFRRGLLEKTLPLVDTAIRMGEDAAFTYPAILLCDTLCYVDRPLYHYRITGQSMSNRYDPIYWERIKKVFQGLSDQAERIGSADFDRQLRGYFLYLANFVIRNECSPANHRTASGMYALAREMTADPRLTGIRVDLQMPRHVQVVYRLLRGRHTAGLFLYLQFFPLYRRLMRQ